MVREVAKVAMAAIPFAAVEVVGDLADDAVDERRVHARKPGGRGRHCRFLSLAPPSGSRKVAGMAKALMVVGANPTGEVALLNP